MTRLMLLSLVIWFAGCATQPTQSFDRSAMNGFKADCSRARAQVDFLQQQIDAYHQHFRSHPITTEDRRYYSRLKNNIWSLRASCSALQR